MAATGQKKAGAEVFLLALAAGRSIAAAARRAGLSRRTASRRLADPEFKAEVARVRGEMLARGLGRLASAYTRAADTMSKLLDSDNDTVRLGAARSIMELGVRLRESVELESRIATNEARIVALESDAKRKAI